MYVGAMVVQNPPKRVRSLSCSSWLPGRWYFLVLPAQLSGQRLKLKILLCNNLHIQRWLGVFSYQSGCKYVVRGSRTGVCGVRGASNATWSRYPSWGWIGGMYWSNDYWGYRPCPLNGFPRSPLTAAPDLPSLNCLKPRVACGHIRNRLRVI